MKNIKVLASVLMLLTLNISTAQTNKFEAGDFGIRYGVMFNGSAVQGLTFSGMVTANIEVGCAVNVQYSKTSATSNNAVSVSTLVNGNYITAPAQQTYQSRSASLNTSVNPFVFYHFKIKNNLDVYAGPSLILGTGSHTLNSTSDNVTVSTGYYTDLYNRTVYPIGYEVGGGLNVGGQYFFYKRLAIGVQATLGVAYTSIDGDGKSFYKFNSSGTNNPNPAENINSAIFAPYISKSLSLSTASSIGVNLTFYLARKAKTPKKADSL